MILSESRRFAFIHNPKVGGMSFRTALKPYDTTGEFFLGWRKYPQIDRVLDAAHLTLAQLRRFHRDVFDMLFDLRVFGFARDPYQRFCSAFSQHLTHNTPQLRAAIRSDEALFFAALDAFAHQALDKDAIRDEVRLVHFRPQSEFFCVGGEQLVTNVRRIEDEGPDDFAADLLGEVERRNISGGPAEGGYDVSRLKQETRDAVARFYEKDFDRFGYAA